MSFLSATRLVFLKDLRIELRTGEIVVMTGLFAVLVTVVASFSFFLDQGTARKVAPGVLWVSITFSGVLAMARVWGRERDRDTLRALLIAPIPRAAIYAGKALVSLVFLLAIEVVLVLLMALFFNVNIIDILPRLVLILLLGTIGFVGMGNLFSVMTVQTSARDLVLSIVMFALITPALLSSVVATRELILGATWAESWGWLQIIVAFDVTFIGAGLVLFERLAAD
ncbi:MAG: heme exporter protein CcmB [Myxococcota bacterium]